MRGLLFFALSLPTPGRSHRSYCADRLHTANIREGVRKKTENCRLLPNPPWTPPLVWFFSENNLTSIFFENEPLMCETNFTLGPIQKSLYLILLYQFTFAHNRPKSAISGALHHARARILCTELAISILKYNWRKI